MTPRQTQALQYLSQLALDFTNQFPQSVKQAMIEKVNIELEVLNSSEDKNHEHG